MSKLRELLNTLLRNQEKKVSDLMESDCDSQKESEKLIFLKSAERELDYLEDLAKFYGE